MTQYKYQYLFTLGNSIVRSSETKETLLKRADNVKDRELIESFIEQEYVSNQSTVRSSVKSASGHQSGQRQINV